MKRRICKIGRRGLMVVALASVAPQSAWGIGSILYWDTNSIGTGATNGTTAAGTWDTITSNWNTNSAGIQTVPQPWNNSSATADFAAGTNATGAYTVTLGTSASISATGLTFEEGTVTIAPGSGSSLTLTGPAPIVSVASGLTATISQALSGGGVSKTNSGTLVLAAANNFTGTVIDSAGTLEVTDPGGLSTSRVALGGGTLDLRGNADTTFGNNVTVTADSTLVANNNGSGSNSAMKLGTLSIGSNTLATSVGNANDFVEFDGLTTLTGNATINNMGSFYLAGGVTGVGFGITKSAGGDLIVGGSSTFSGGTSINLGTLRMRSSSALGTGTITLGPTSGGSSAGLALDDTGLNVSTPLTLRAGSTGTSGLLLSDQAPTTAVSTYSGNITLQNPFAVSANYAGQVLNVTGVIDDGAGSFAVTAGGAPGTVVFSNANTYDGGTSVISGQLQITNSAAMGTGAVTLGDTSGPNTATLALGVSTGGLSVSNPLTVRFGAFGTASLSALNTSGTNTYAGSVLLNKALTVNVATGGTLAVTGSISGNGGLTMSGPGTLALTANSSFTGPLTVTSGTLQIAADQTPSSIYVGGPTGATVLQSAGTVTDSGSASIASVSGDVGTYNLTGGTLSVGTDFTLGVDNPAHAVFNLNTAGFLNVTETEYINGMFTQDIDTTNTASSFAVGYTAGTTGNYDMEDGILNGGVVENIGYQGTATFTQNGGIHNTSEMFITAAAGQTSTYTMSDGNLNIFVPGNPNDLYIGGMAAGTASFSQSGGTVTIAGALDLSHVSGIYGSYDLSGGTLTAAAEYIGDGGNGTFTQELGSTNNAQFMEIGFAAGSTGTYTISGGTLNLTGVSFFGPLIVGDQGTGTLNISANAIVNTSGNADVGLSSGSTGTVNQIGGTVNIGSSTTPADLFIARNPGSTGSYSLSGDDSLTVWSGMFLGYQGAGTFTQNGGQVAVKEVNANGNTGFLSIGNNNPTSVGTYTISSGNLSADTGIYIGGTPGNGGGAGSSLNILGGSVNSGVVVFPGNTLVVNGGSLNAGFTLNGTANLMSGSINCSDEEVIYGSTAVFTQSGGTNSITNVPGHTGSLFIYSGAQYNLNAGTLTADNVDIGGTSAPIGPGTMTINGGALTVNQTLRLETNGTINLNTGGSFSTVNLVNNGTINIIGGTWSVSGTNTGTGSINETSGTQSVASGSDYSGVTQAVTGSNAAVTSAGSVSYGATAPTTLSILNGASATFAGNLGVGNAGSLTTGAHSGTSVLNVQGPLTAHEVLLGNTLGADGALNIAILGNVKAAGLNLNDVTITDGSLQIVSQPPQAGDDPEIIGSIVGGYQRDGTLNVQGGSITAPTIKMGITSGNKGTYLQTAGTVTVTTFASGNDANLMPLARTAGINPLVSPLGAPAGPNGIASITGGTLNATSILIGSDNSGHGSLTIDGNATVTATTTTVGANGSLLYSNGSFSPGDVTIEDGGTMTIDETGMPSISGIMPLAQNPIPKVTVYNSLTITGSSSLDMTDNDADIHTTALSQITAYLQSGFKNGAWNGSGIISSTAKSTPAVTALAVEQNAVQNTLTGAYTSQPILTQWENITVALNDVLVKYTLVGDADLSGSVNGTDYLLTDEGFDSHGVLTGWRNGDFDYDGKVNGDDYSLIDNVYNIEQSTKYNIVTAGAAEMIATNTLQTESAVPEPGAMMLLGAMSCGLLKRRRR